MNDPRPAAERADADADTDVARLRGLASNLWWSWHRPVSELLASLPGGEPGDHPLRVVDRLAGERPGELDHWLVAHTEQLAALAGELDELAARSAPPEIAYLCPEFGLAAQVPQYSGGLGILAGDHLKAASDLGVPVIGVGLFYRQGFFGQQIVDYAQQERPEPVEPEAVGAVDTGVRVEVMIAGEPVTVRVWQMGVGGTTLVLLDAGSITDQLYGGDRRHRLSQELVLGVGGLKALRALGHRPRIYHLNEGHACFVLLELLAEQLGGAAGHDLDRGIAAVRASTLFTTHTPVPAGIDRFDRALVRPEMERWTGRLGVTTDELLDWATMPSDGPLRPFNTAALAFKLCGQVNGVSQLHAKVGRDLFASLGPAAARIEGVTNGVHARTWVDPQLQDLYDRRLGPGWANGEAGAWARAGELDPEAFGALRAAGRQRLVELVEHLTGVRLDAGHTIFGFARRFATYKRAALLLRDPDGLAASLEAGAQFVFAGKAHPADTGGKAVLAELARFAARSGGRIALVPGYDIDIARALYQGSDVWLNNPVRPHEACGTSGEKAALNGVLNCSISDGWWADWYTPGIGWVIPTSDEPDPAERDRAEAAALHRVLADEVLPLFADPDDRGWWEMVVAMLAHLGPKVTAGRMVAEYDRRFYNRMVGQQSRGGS